MKTPFPDKTTNKCEHSKVIHKIYTFKELNISLHRYHIIMVHLTLSCGKTDDFENTPENLYFPLSMFAVFNIICMSLKHRTFTLYYSTNQNFTRLFYFRL